MTPTIKTEYGESVEERARKVGIKTPESVVILPQNYFSAEEQSDFKLNQEALTVEKLLQEEGIETDDVIDTSGRSVSHTWSAETIGPLIHFTADFIADNWEGVLTTISIIQTYYSAQRDESVQFTFSAERPDGSTERIEYQGPPGELDSVTDLIREQDSEAGSPEGNQEDAQHDKEEPESA